MTSPLITVITVTHNSAHIVRTALASLPADLEVICVDNASADDIAAALSDFPVRRIDNDTNLGFGRACNIGASAVSGEYLLFMNPDVCLAAGAIDTLLEAAKRYPNANVFMPRTTTADGRLWFHGQNEIDRLSGVPGSPRVSDIWGDCCVRFVDGGVFMIRRTLFLEMGGFDEGIFLYFEDDDLSHRLLQRDEPLILVSNAHAVHDVGSSVAKSMRSQIMRHRSKMRSEVYLRRKYGIVYRPFVDILRCMAKIIFYCLTFNRNRLLNSSGRLIGVVDSMLGRSHGSKKIEICGVDRGAGRNGIYLNAPGRYLLEVVTTNRQMPFLRLNVRLRPHPDKVVYVPSAQRTTYLLESTESGLVLEFDSRDIISASIRPLKIGDMVALLRRRRRQKRFELSLLDLPFGQRIVLRPLLHISGSDGRELATALRGVASWGFGPASDNLQKTLRRHFDGPPAQTVNRLPTTEPKIAIAVHLHYAEFWPEFEALLETIDRPFQLILTLTQPDPALAERVRAIFPGSEILVYDNRGRDVGPFIQLLREGHLDGFDLICKLHGKKSGMSGPRMLLGEVWRLASAFDLIGSRDVVDRIVDEFARSPDTGMIGSRRFRLPNEWKDEEAAWSENKAMILNLLATMGMASKSHLDFFAGTMFWVRRSALEPLRQLDLSLASFPDEAGQQDGTLQHALERVLGMICTKVSEVAWDDVDGRAPE